jgi:hypothetical protein
MANSNVPQDKRKAKLKRRRREIDRMIAKMEAGGAAPQGQGAAVKDLPRRIRDLRKTMRYER